MDDVFIKFRGKFIDEALSLVKNIEQSLIQLENNSSNKESIQKVFRFAHTLKGVSGMYGFNKIADYTHKLETLFDCIQSGTLSVNTAIIDLTLQSADHIKSLLSDFDFVKEENQINQVELLGKINLYVQGDINKQVTNVKSITKVIESKTKSYYIHFTPDKGMLARGVRITNIFRDLAEVGSFEIFKHHAEVPIKAETNIPETWGIFLSSVETIETIEDVFVFVEENYKLYKLSDNNLFDDLPNTETSKLDHKNQTLHIEDLQQLSQPELIKIIHQSIEENETNTKNETKNTNIKTSTNIPEILSQSINVDTQKIDTLMYLVSELVTSNAQLKLGFKNADMNQLKMVVENIEKLTKQFRDNTFSLRLTPVQENIFRFQRLVRDLSGQLNKQIKFEIEGGETELDKSILDKLTEPLMHLVRNSIDHGIETPEIRVAEGKPPTGLLKFAAQHSGNHIIISISDDGSGIDEQRILAKAIKKGIIKKGSTPTQQEIFDLVFLPGFSTAESLTEISGRGVGMDVVKKKITELKGEVRIISEKGKGTEFIIKLQQTVSIIDSLLFQANEMNFLVPLTDIEECSLVNKEVFDSKKTTNTVPFNNQLIPYIDLYKLYNLKKPDTKNLKLLVINKQNNRFAIAADEIIGEHQAVLKSMGKQVKKQENIAGASILGDGKLAFLLDISALQQTLTVQKN